MLSVFVDTVFQKNKKKRWMVLVIRLQLSCLITHYNPRWIKYSPALIEEEEEEEEEGREPGLVLKKQNKKKPTLSPCIREIDIHTASDKQIWK